MSKARHSWTTAETATLRSLYPDQPTRTIAAMLGIDLALVYSKASRLGLRKSAQFLATDKNWAAFSRAVLWASSRSLCRVKSPGTQARTMWPVAAVPIPALKKAR